MPDMPRWEWIATIALFAAMCLMIPMLGGR